jgi:hypothetical protein
MQKVISFQNPLFASGVFGPLLPAFRNRGTEGPFKVSCTAQRFLICYLAFSFFLVTVAAAQPPVGVKLGLGLTAPAVSLMPNSYSTSSAETNTGLLFGLFTQVSLPSNWILQPALQMAFKGFNERVGSNSTTNSFTYSHTITYLELPLNLVHATKPKGSGFQIGAGPVVGLLLNRGAQLYPLKLADFGVDALVGYQAPIGFSVSFSYTHGLVDISKNKAFLPEMKNRFAALSVGYLF